jgi:hypothetical protein
MKLILQKLIEAVLDETGIKLSAKDIQISADAGSLKIDFWGFEMLDVSYDDNDLEDENFADEVVKELFKEHFDLREKLIELKLDDLNNNHLSKIYEDILERLENHKVDERLLDVLDFEFVDLGYNNGNFTNPGEEEWNFPPMALRVTDFEDLEHCISIDPYKDPASLNYENICGEIIKKIRGKI